VETPQDHRNRKDGPEGLSGFARAMREAEPYLQASWSLIGAVAVGALAGYFADEKLETSPWLLVVGSLFGMSSGMYAFFRAVLTADKKRKARR
jgi:F0F1-type ATP synthase assembly protein I